jgi:hypothetical protein
MSITKRYTSALEEQSGAHNGFWDVLGSHGPIKSAAEGEKTAERQIQQGSGQKRLFRYILYERPSPQ